MLIAGVVIGGAWFARRIRANQYATAAMTAFMRNDDQGAIALANKALAIAPTLERALIPRIQAQFEIAACDDLEATALRILAVNPKNVRVYAYRSICETYRGHRELATRYAATALNMSPDRALARVAQAYASMAKHDFEAAIDAARRAVALDDGLALSHSVLGVALALNGHVEALTAASAECEQAISMRPRLADAWRCRGLVANATGDYSGALAAADMAIKLAPTLSPAYGVKVAANLGLGRPEVATRELQLAGTLWPNDAAYQRHLCDVLSLSESSSDGLTELCKVRRVNARRLDAAEVP